jgi:hypothetical protein
MISEEMRCPVCKHPFSVHRTKGRLQRCTAELNNGDDCDCSIQFLKMEGTSTQREED